MKFEADTDLLKLEIAQSSFKKESAEHGRFIRAISFVKNKLVEEKDFPKETTANLYFSEARIFIENIEKNFNKFKDKYVELEILNEKNRYSIDNFWLYNWIIVPLLYLGVIGGFAQGVSVIYYEWDRAKGLWTIINLIFLPVALPMIYIFSAWIFSLVVSSPFYFLFHKPRAFKKIESKQINLPDWIDYIQYEIKALFPILNSANEEALRDIAYKKNLQSKRDALELQDEFQKRVIDDRLKIIREETENAIRASKSLEEQHERTEQIRIKYALEMADIERNVSSANDNALMSKLHMLKSLFGDEQS